MAVGKIEAPFQAVSSTGYVAPVVETLSNEYKSIIANLYCSAESPWTLAPLFKFVDFDPEKGFKYRLVGTGSFYAFPQVKDGSYLVGRKHYPIPVIEKQLKGQFILANSFSVDAFDTAKLSEPEFYRDLNKAAVISAGDRLDFIAYLIFKGSTGKYEKNEYFETIISDSYDKNDGSTNGYPMYHVTFDLKDATNANFKVTNNEIKTTIEALRTKIKTNKEEIDVTKDKLGKLLLRKNLTITDDNISYIKSFALREELDKLITKIVLNPHKYAITKSNVAKFRYPVRAKDLIIMASTNINHNWRYSLKDGLDADGTDFFDAVRAKGITVIENPCFEENEILVVHKDAIQLAVNSRFTKTWIATYQDPQITNFNNTVAIFMGTIDELPCVTLKFKA